MSAYILPPALGLRVVSREPVVDVRIETALNGKETRSSWWTIPRYRYRVQFEALRTSGSRLDFAQLASHFTRHWGSLDSFLFTDEADSSVTAHGFGLGNGSTTAYQLQRSHLGNVFTASGEATVSSTSGASYWPSYLSGFEPCYDVKASTVLIYIDGALKTLTTHYTLGSTGIVTFVSAPASNAVLTWTGTYYRRVRFDGGLSFERVASGYYNLACDLISVKP